MKINVFRIEKDQINSLTEELENADYEPIVDIEKDAHYMVLYLRRKASEVMGWIDFYKEIMTKADFNKYSENLGSENLSGVYIIKNSDYIYAITHGQAHFIVRKHCDKDFGLDLAERIVDPIGLKMKHLKYPIIKNYLQNVNSSLINDIDNLDTVQIAKDLRIADGPTEYYKPLNVGLLFFNDHPETFFPYSQIEVVNRGCLKTK